MATPNTNIPRKKIEDQLKELEKNVGTLTHNLEVHLQQAEKLRADITATRGAIQLARMILDPK